MFLQTVLQDARFNNQDYHLLAINWGDCQDNSTFHVTKDIMLYSRIILNHLQITVPQRSPIKACQQRRNSTGDKSIARTRGDCLSIGPTHSFHDKSTSPKKKYTPHFSSGLFLKETETSKMQGQIKRTADGVTGTDEQRQCIVR
jgi:hypothetical protein